MRNPLWKKILKFLLFQYDWKVMVDMDPDMLKDFLRKKFYRNKAIAYKFKHRSFSFLYSKFSASMYGAPVSMIGHMGKINSIDGMTTEIEFSCRFTFLANIHLLACLSFFIAVFMGELAIKFAILLCVADYIFAMTLYLIDIYDAQRILKVYLEDHLV